MNPKIKNLTRAERIEYVFGKDKYPDLFFKAHIPQAQEIKVNKRHFTKNVLWKDCTATSIHHDGVTYEFNNLGYRCHYDYHSEDLKSKNNILCVGDSDIFGPYKNYDTLWPQLLQKKLPEFNIINLGMPDWASDTMARVVACSIKELLQSVKYVLLLWPNDNRREFVNKSYSKIVGNQAVTDVPYMEYWDYIDWVSNNYNTQKNSNLITWCCQANSTEFFPLLIVKNNKLNIFDGEGDNFGKGVYGPDTHVALCEYFFKKIKRQPGLYEGLNT